MHALQNTAGWMRGASAVVLIMMTCQFMVVAGALAADFVPTAQETIVPDDTQVELVFSNAEFTEGPVPTAAGTILFSDIGNRILQYDPATGKTEVFRDPSGRANGLMFDRQGRLLAAEGANGGNRRVSITTTDGEVKTLSDRFDGKRLNSPNDVAAAPSGAVYFTDPRYGDNDGRELDFEAVFVITPAGETQLATRDVRKPNGVLVSADETIVYVADSDTSNGNQAELLAFDVQDDGTLSGKRSLFQFPVGQRGIDGMTLDRQGNIYATAGRGETAGVYVFSPSGKQLAFIPMPGSPTNCVFGLGEAQKTLYVTAALPEAERSETRRYGLYRIELLVPGYHLFEGTAE